MKVSSWYSSWDLICLLTPLPRPPIWLLVWRDPNQYHRKTGQGGRGRVGNGMEGGPSFNCKTMFQQAWWGLLKCLTDGGGYHLPAESGCFPMPVMDGISQTPEFAFVVWDDSWVYEIVIGVEGARVGHSDKSNLVCCHVGSRFGQCSAYVTKTFESLSVFPLQNPCHPLYCLVPNILVVFFSPNQSSTGKMG